MEKRFANGKRFNADPAEIENLERNKAKQIIGIVIGAVVLILAFVFGHLQNEAYDHSEHELYNVLKICCIIIGLSNIVLSPIVLYGYMGVERNLSQTHIILYDDGIEGVCINNGVCVPFAVSYFEVVGAVTGSAMVDNGSNLKIKTKDKTYSCYAIEQPRRVAALVNEKVAEYAARVTEEAKIHTLAPDIVPPPTVHSSELASEVNTVPLQSSDGIFCIYCGTKLPNEAVFCSACGKETIRTR